MFGQAEGCLGTSVIASACTMVPCPALLSPVEASTVPTVFMTAWSCLREAAQLKPGQRVLIHAATGDSCNGPEVACNINILHLKASS